MNRHHRPTNPCDLVTAYRAAGREREAETAERVASASSAGDDAYQFPQELLELCRQLKVLRDHARSFGIFVDDRDLLTCEVCGLEEDVLINGLLITRQAGDADAPDTGLRFEEIGTDHFKCPRCGHVVVLREVDPKA